MTDKAKNHWLILMVLALAQFMVVLDVSIVNVALPAIKHAFDMSTSSLQWVVTAYTLAFGGFLLLGGRAADLYGRRKMFVIGTVLFGLASLVNGFSQSETMLIAMRAVQGLSAALMSPAALSIVLVTYREGHERNTALSVWGAVASGGAAAGVLLGGIITEYWGWRWNFFINVPVTILVAYAAWKLVPAHDSEEKHNELDLPGAVSITGALMLLVYALVEAPSKGWTSGGTLGFLAAAAALLAFFIWNERRVKHPLVPLHIFKVRNVTGANIVQMPIVAGMFSTFFFVSLYAQTVLGFSPVKTGLSFLAVPLSIGISASLVPKLVKRVGFKPILVVAPLITASALFYLSHLRVDGNYWHDLFPGFVLMGIGMGATFIAITIAATSGVTGRESGLASGLLNTSQQIGGAIGLAVLTGVAASAATNYFKNLTSAPNQLTPLFAQVHGFHIAFLVATGFMLAASLLAFLLLKQPKMTAKERANETAAIGMH
ncbi:DHA2 family efflux MFS transporter permease subunit [Candidatus Saccharibacteria bacterium]|nr:MAG: DHA2 family efflux MFS transporter permease subunit [Candidatus Saccharibacteria bacterium]